jgi:hypothetical protein
MALVLALSFLDDAIKGAFQLFDGLLGGAGVDIAFQLWAYHQLLLSAIDQLTAQSELGPVLPVQAGTAKRILVHSVAKEYLELF